MRERSFFFCLGQTSHTHLSFAKPKRKRGWILACGSCLCHRIFGGAAASSLGAAAFGATAGFLRTGAAFGCAAARLLRAGFDDAFKGALELLVEGARRAADAAADVVALLMLLLLLDDPSAAVSGRQASDAALVCHRLRCHLNCRRLKMKTGYRSFVLAALAYCSLVFFVIMPWGH